MFRGRAGARLWLITTGCLDRHQGPPFDMWVCSGLIGEKPSTHAKHKDGEVFLWGGWMEARSRQTPIAGFFIAITLNLAGFASRGIVL